MAKSKIEWTEYTWNPIVGCSKVSAGCDNCYAERMAWRIANMEAKKINYDDPIKFDNDIKKVKYAGVVKSGKWNGKTFLVEDELGRPLHWRKPAKIFVCSMGDLFHESVLFEWIDEVFAVIWESHFRHVERDKNTEHIFQILTKRPERMLDYFLSLPWGRVPDIVKEKYNRHFGAGRLAIPPNVWFGVTAENQKTAVERIPVLLQISAATKFVSVEPMLGSVDLRLNHNEIDWVICGCESGPKRRETKIEWIRDLRDQCIEADVPFFLKQMDVAGKLVKMPELDGKVWDQ